MDTQSSVTVVNNREGPKRKIEPMRYKTRICRHFLETGSCPFSPNCAFAHGNHELRTFDDNMAIAHRGRMETNTHNSMCGSDPMVVDTSVVPTPHMNNAAPVFLPPGAPHPSYCHETSNTMYPCGNPSYPYASATPHTPPCPQPYSEYLTPSMNPGHYYDPTCVAAHSGYDSTPCTCPSCHYYASYNSYPNPYGPSTGDASAHAGVRTSYTINPYATYPTNPTETMDMGNPPQYPPAASSYKPDIPAPVPSEPTVYVPPPTKPTEPMP